MTTAFQNIRVTSLRESTEDTHHVFDLSKLKELAQSIKAKGINGRLIARPQGDETYEIVAGYRCYHAAKLAGLRPYQKESIMSDRIAYVIVPGAKPGDRIAYVTLRESGYMRTTYDRPGMSEADCKQIVLHLNAQLGVTSNIALSMLAGSMFGWHVPGAQDAIAHFSLLG